MLHNPFPPFPCPSPAVLGCKLKKIGVAALLGDGGCDPFSHLARDFIQAMPIDANCQSISGRWNCGVQWDWQARQATGTPKCICRWTK